MNTTYHILSKRVSGSSIGLLENDAENVVTLVSQEYEVRKEKSKYKHKIYIQINSCLKITKIKNCFRNWSILL